METRKKKLDIQCLTVLYNALFAQWKQKWIFVKHGAAA